MAHPDPMEMVQSKDSIRSIALRPMLIWYDQTEKKSRIKEVKHNNSTVVHVGNASSLS